MSQRLMFCRLKPVMLADPINAPTNPLRVVEVWTAQVEQRAGIKHLQWVNGQSLLLAEDDALAMVAAFGEPEYQASLVEGAIKENGWVERRALMAAVGLIGRLADMLTAHFGIAKSKYLQLRIDLRGGEFTVQNLSGEEFTQDMLAMAREKLGKH